MKKPHYIFIAIATLSISFFGVRANDPEQEESTPLGILEIVGDPTMPRFIRYDSTSDARYIKHSDSETASYELKSIIYQMKPIQDVMERIGADDQSINSAQYNERKKTIFNHEKCTAQLIATLEACAQYQDKNDAKELPSIRKELHVALCKACITILRTQQPTYSQQECLAISFRVKQKCLPFREQEQEQDSTE